VTPDGGRTTGSARSRSARWLAALATLLAAAALAWLLWNPYAATEQSFDRGHNGLWVGHQWYTGRHVRTGEPIGEEERERFAEVLADAGIRYAYVHVGPIRADGTIEDTAGPEFRELRERTPDTLYLAWMGGIAARLPVADPDWRSAVVETAERLRSEGFDGIHLNIEPLEDHHPGYLELLRALREHFGHDFLLSHATRRAGPFGVAFGPLGRLFWSERFYRETMALVDQTVLMAYDTKMDVPKHYVAFVKYQTGLLVKWACEEPGHQVLIGIPSYEDVPLYSNPKIENIRNAALGVRAALEEVGSEADCFEGVAVYADWVTDADEWLDYRRFWLNARPRDE
jgi:hypothetical protein